MIKKTEYPITEFDTDKTAKLNPRDFPGEEFGTDKLIITFFSEVIEKMLGEKIIEPERTIYGENNIYIYRFTDERDILITPGYVGCPACGGNLDLLSGMGIKKVMFCGGGGVIDSEIKLGQVLLAEGAVRDEGFSYHYIEPSRYIYCDAETTGRIAGYLDKKGVSYLRGLTWTTDAIFRETGDRIALRKSEGAKIVEMEQAGCMAVAQFRQLKYGALIYGGDDLASDEWSDRGWRSCNGLRYDLVGLCREILRII